MNMKTEREYHSLIKRNKHAIRGAIASLLLLPLAAWAGGVVTNCTETDLRAAMAGGGVVTFACDGTILLASSITNASVTTLDGSGHQVTVSGYGAPVFVVNTNVSFTVVNLVVANTTSLGGSGILNLGGTVDLTGVTFRSNTATLFISTGFPPELHWNLHPSGGAIDNVQGTVNATNCSFVGNTAQTMVTNNFIPATAFGGAISNGGQMHLQGCTFVCNQTWGGAGLLYNGGVGDAGFGGAIANGGMLTVDLCTFTSNSASGGGGAWVGTASTPGLSGAEGSGGAIYNHGTLKVDRTTFCGNIATGGGGSAGGMPSTLDGYAGGNGGSANGAAICNLGSLSVARSTFASNVITGGAGGEGGSGRPWNDIGGKGGSGGDGGSGLGGALFNTGTASLVNCTIAVNTGNGGIGGGGGAGASNRYGGQGGSGGNGGAGLGGVHGTCNLTNCTIAGNLGRGGTGGTGGPGGSGAPSGHAGSPGSDGATGAACGGTACSALVNTLIASNTPAGGDSFPDPKLGPLADNGGPTLTMALLPGSPAIDAADPAVAPATDQRGIARPVGPAPDIGAFEYGLPAVLGISGSEGTGFNILVSAYPGQSCRLLASRGFSDWIAIATNQIGPNGTLLLHVERTTGGTGWFYRVVMP
jgi:hypothetical protein